MIKIMIVDDEFLVRMGIASLIVWENYEYTIVAEAENGEDALEKIEKFRPQIVLTDLMMNHGDGFSLIEACMKKYSDMRFIVLSNYNDFENVKKAMKLGACDYIFKLTLNKTELLDALKEASRGIKKEVPEHGAGKEGHQNTGLIKADLLKSLLEARDHYYEKVLKSFANISLCVDIHGAYYVMMILIDNFKISQHKGDFLEKDLLKFTMENMICEIFGLEDQMEIFLFEECNFVLLFSAEKELDKGDLSEKFDLLNKSAGQYYGLKLSGTISGAYHGPEQFRKAVEANQSVAQLRFWEKSHQLVWFEADLARPFYGKTLSEVSGDPVYWKAAMFSGDVLYQKVDRQSDAHIPELLNEQELDERLRRDGLMAGIDYVNQLFRRINESVNIDIANVRKMLGRVSRILTYYLGKQNIELDHILDSNKVDFENAVKEYDYFEDICRSFEEIQLQCLELQGKKRRPERSEILQAKQYVHMHLEEKFSISQIAELVNMSESRFSHVFKNETGTTFWEFVNSERMNRAEQLLRETNLKVSDIAEQIGMENPNYFSTQFKKKNGISPLEFRKTR